MLKKGSKQEVVTSVFIFLWIFIINIGTPLVTSWPAWPMFFVTIFFFIMGGDIKKIPSIFLSGLVGIGSAFILIKLLGLLGPVIGETPATALLLGAVLALIIIGGNFAPGLFNNVAFAYLTVCGIDLTIIENRFVGWVVMHTIGGGIILSGALLIFMVVGKIFEKKKGLVQP